MKLAAGLHRKATALALSSAVPFVQWDHLLVERVQFLVVEVETLTPP